MALQHLAIKFRPKDRDLNIVLNDIRFVVNQLVDIASSGTMTDYLVKVGASGTADYLSSDYFSRSAAGHIIIKNAYTAGTGIAGGGDLSAARTFSLSHLGIESLTDPGADRIFFWDDGESASKWLSPNTALEISTTNLNVKYDNVTIKVDGSNQLYAAIGAAESDPVFSAWIAGPPDVSEFTNDVGYLTSVTAHNLLSATHGDTTVGTVVRGDIITGQGATPKWVRLAKGTTGYFLKADATDAVWAAHGLTYSDVGALASGGTAVDSDKWDGYQFADYLDQTVKSTSGPTFDHVHLGAGGFSTSTRMRAYLGAEQVNLTNATYTKVTLNTENYDPGNNFDSVTNYRFTAPVTGYYFVHGKISYNDFPTPAGVFGLCAFYVDGVAVSSNVGFANDSHSGEFTVSHTDVIYMVASSYLELYAYQSSGVSTVDIYNGTNETFMAVHLLSIA